jgi:putative Mg2+ transporter-C (MgtC) family protein
VPGRVLDNLFSLAVHACFSAAIGLEREARHLRRSLLLISKYGFTNVLANDRVVLDRSRVAAQIFTGIGFTGAGLIFVRGDRAAG